MGKEGRTGVLREIPKNVRSFTHTARIRFYTDAIARAENDIADFIASVFSTSTPMLSA